LTLQQTLARVPGVARVSPDLQGTALIAGKDGIAVGGNGAPGLGFAFDPDSAAFTLIKGTAPTGPDQVAVESSTLGQVRTVGGRHHPGGHR
jgi:putative ABC transport system permease protein